MRSHPILTRLATLVLVAIATASCGDTSAPTAVAPTPPEAPSALLGTILGTSREANVLQRSTPLATTLRVSKTIGLFGGTIEIPAAGLHVYVPPAALLRRTTITVTAPAGSAVAYEFAPHGTRFLAPIMVTQKLDGTAYQGANPASMFAAYFSDLSQIDLATGIAPVTEILNLVLAGSNTVRFPVGHFSGYLIATGFKESSGGSSDAGY